MAARHFTIGEFFCGAGGMSLGALEAASGTLEGVASICSSWAVDYEADACRSYHKNVHKEHGRLVSESDGGLVPGINLPQGSLPLVLNADVRNVDFDMLNSIDGFLFGFPCNDFSTAGKMRGLEGAFGMLYEAGLGLVRKKRPQFFVAENVSGLLHANEYGAFIRIMEELRLADLDADGQGYTIVPHLYRFEEYGVPQTRHRIIIVGIRNDVLKGEGVLERGFLPPAPTGERVTAGEALSAPYAEGVTNNEEKRVNEIVSERLKLIEPGQNIWDVNDTLPEHLRLKPTKTTISSIYKVLDRDKPAYTVVGNGGGGTHMYHWDRRPTTDRERARLQTFPDWFEFVGGQQSVRKQIGMAVPPKGARVIIEAVLKTLCGIDYPYVEPNLSKELDRDYVEKKRARRQREKDAKARKLDGLGSTETEAEPVLAPEETREAA